MDLPSITGFALLALGVAVNVTALSAGDRVEWRSRPRIAIRTLASLVGAGCVIAGIGLVVYGS